MSAKTVESHMINQPWGCWINEKIDKIDKTSETFRISLG